MAASSRARLNVTGAAFTAWAVLAVALPALAQPVAAEPDPSPAAPATYADVQRWYADAARADDPRAQFLMGLRAKAGVTGHRTPGTPDLAAAAAWFLKAARQGHADAQFQLGLAYLEGAGVARDVVAAAHWFRRAAESGHATAQFNLGLLLERGVGAGAESKTKAKAKAKAKAKITPEASSAALARKWFEAAAAQGVLPAMRRLAAMDASGAGGTPDPLRALMWLEVAISRAGPDAGPKAESDEVFRRFLVEQLTPADITRAESLARERLAVLPAVAPATDRPAR